MQPYQRLEQEWAEWNHLDPAGMVVCSSGTAALHLALEALQLPPRAWVICPDFTMIACPRAIVLANLEPVFIDCYDNLLLNTSMMDWWLQGVKAGSVCAVMPVHVYGRRCNMEAVAQLAKIHDLKVVEDLAEAHGIQPHKDSDAACWSFYKNKIIHGEEGGAVWFKNLKHASIAKELRSMGFTEAHDFMHRPRGHNYRLSNVHAQLVGESIINSWNERHGRRNLEEVYDKHCPIEWKMPPRDAPWVYDIRIPGLSSEQQSTIVRRLNQADIGARHAFKPMSIQEEFVNCHHVKGKTALAASCEVIYFPLSLSTSTYQVKLCFDTCRTALDLSQPPT